ncbi:MAG: replicative DNA helicase [Bacteroidales bacterium]|jgi:replicative DNA helicase|nr:replicative DNA helicase [Bacteroidales bacterium]
MANNRFPPAVFRQNSPITDNTRMLGMEAGKLPPQAIDMEEYVIGAILLEKDAIDEISDFLKPECFYKEAHAKIFQAALDLSIKEDPIDANTVMQELRRKEQLEEIGGAYYLAVLTNKVMSAANINYNARIIHQKYLQRELIRISTDIQKSAFDEGTDVDELLNRAEQELFEISQGSIKKDVQSVGFLLTGVLEKIEHAKETGILSGIQSGFTDLDRITGGWQPTDLIIIAARPAMGKTAFILSMARNMALEHKVGVAVFSLEMSSSQLVMRLIVSETEIDKEKLRTGKLDKEDYDRLYDKIAVLTDAQIFIDDTPALSIVEFRTKCRRLVQQHHIKAVFIDYLQLMTWTGDTRGGNREQEVSNISRSLKAIAKELDIPIVALSQLNRGVEARTGLHNKRPQLSDLRESGAIEQDADIVAFIHRPEYYGFNEDDEGHSLIGIAEIIIAKHRNGAVGMVNLKFKPEFAKFVEQDSMMQLSGIQTFDTVKSVMNDQSDAEYAFPQATTNADGNGAVPF